VEALSLTMLSQPALELDLELLSSCRSLTRLQFGSFLLETAGAGTGATSLPQLRLPKLRELWTSTVLSGMLDGSGSSSSCGGGDSASLVELRFLDPPSTLPPPRIGDDPERKGCPVQERAGQARAAVLLRAVTEVCFAISCPFLAAEPCWSRGGLVCSGGVPRWKFCTSPARTVCRRRCWPAWPRTARGSACWLCPYRARPTPSRRRCACC
jgi:hypothetical protein